MISIATQQILPDPTLDSYAWYNAQPAAPGVQELGNPAPAPAPSTPAPAPVVQIAAPTTAPKPVPVPSPTITPSASSPAPSGSTSTSGSANGSTNGSTSTSGSTSVSDPMLSGASSGPAPSFGGGGSLGSLGSAIASFFSPVPMMPAASSEAPAAEDNGAARVALFFAIAGAGLLALRMLGKKHG